MGDLVAIMTRAARQRWPLGAGGAAFVGTWIGLWLGWAGLNETRQGVLFAVLVFLPLWNWFAHCFGKRKAYVAGMSFWALVQMVLIFVQPGSALWMVLGLAILAGVGVSTAHMIPVSIIPDTIEWDELHTGLRREGIYYSLVSLLNKVGSSIAVPAASLLLGWAGYVPNQPQSTRTLWAIRSLVGPIPAVLLIAGILMATFYPLTRERHAHLRKELARRLLVT